jgi:hypothetical protein
MRQNGSSPALRLTAAPAVGTIDASGRTDPLRRTRCPSTIATAQPAW